MFYSYDRTGYIGGTKDTTKLLRVAVLDMHTKGELAIQNYSLFFINITNTYT